jgi:hypothetical protein
MPLLSVAPAGLLAPTIHVLRNVKICQAGNYQDKFGQIHRHQLFQWAANYKKKGYVPILLEHHSFTWPFFGYVYSLSVVDDFLIGDICLTKYGVETLLEYKDRHMGCGWSVGILADKSCIGELTLCRRPRVSTTHIMSLGEIVVDPKLLNSIGIKDENGALDIGDQVVGLVKEIINFEARGATSVMEEKMRDLQKLIVDNNIRIDYDDEE